jgi:hypothetical protein
MTEDDDDDDEEGGAAGGTDTAKKKTKKSKRRSATTMTESAENIRNNMTTAAVSGVSHRPPLVTLSIPPPPVRGVGMRLDSMFGGDTTNKPAMIGSRPSRQIQVPTVPPAAYKPKFIAPKNVSFPLPVEWSSHLTEPSPEYRFRLSRDEGESEEEDDEEALFQQSDFYGSSYLCRPESILLSSDPSTRPRQPSVVLYAASSSSLPDRDDDRAISPTSGESDNDRLTPLPRGSEQGGEDDE